MERTQIFDMMGELKLFGMKAAFDEIMAIAPCHDLIAWYHWRRSLSMSRIASSSWF
jgi:hypothetical protein